MAERPPPGDIAGPDLGGRALPRRDFLRVLAAGAGSLAGAAGLGRPARAAAGVAPLSFPDGVKCGDPWPGGAVVWTRVDRPSDGRPVPVVWTVAEDPAMERVVGGGVAWARDGDGHMVKVEARGLAADRWYHYRFDAAGAASPVGRLRTAPRGNARPDRLRYAFASCQQRNASYYVAHRAIAQERVDFLMHLGDYIYVSDGGDLTIDDYRRRWRIFHSNPLLQELHAAVPLVAMWDDGEFYNGVDRTGPPARLAAARQAWFEHMPVRRRGDDRVYRQFRWGGLADVFMIDVRSYRDPEVPANVRVAAIIDGQDTRLPPGEQMFASGRTTLGARQRGWLERRLRRSGAAWRLIGNPYNMNPWKIEDLDTPALRAANPLLPRNGGVYVSNEAWDDYAAERRELLEYIWYQQIRNVVFTSGHTHIYLASELQPDWDDAAWPTVAFDFVTGSLTADPDPREIAPEPFLRAAEQIMRQANDPYLRYVNLLDQGYAIVDVTPEELIVEFRVLDTLDAAATARTAARFRVVDGSRTIETLFTER